METDWGQEVAGPIAIVEPHYDDAWVNLGGMILQHPHIRFRIISVSEDFKNNQNETQQLSQYIPNVETVALRLQGVPWSFRGNPQKGINHFCESNGFSGLDELNSRIDCLVEDCQEVILPLGLEHPQHDVISRLSCRSVKRHSYYREFPYFFPPGHQGMRRILLVGRQKIAHAHCIWKKISGLVRETIDIRPCLKEKVRIFKEVYPSQSFLLELERGPWKLSSMKNEMIFRPASKGWSQKIRTLAHVFQHEFGNTAICF